MIVDGWAFVSNVNTVAMAEAIESERILISIFLRSELSFVSYLRQCKRLRRAQTKSGRGNNTALPRFIC
jgi:hypothetical protein